MKNDACINSIKADILEKIKRTLESPADFDYLSQEIQKSCGETVSSTTLKRIFGYIPSISATRLSTLSVLARYLGYSGWSTYIQAKNNNQSVNSDFVVTRTIVTSSLNIGDIVHFEWSPGRVCEAEFLGGDRFIITLSKNTKLQIGDTFQTSAFVNGIAFTAINLKQARGVNSRCQNYSVGQKSGIFNLHLVKKG